jgi:endoglucanase
VEALIKQLAEAWGPSGFEHQIRDLIRAEVEPLAEEIVVDALGNLICRIGSGDERIMTTAHMDEIGVIVSHIDKQGFARFSNIGTLFPATLMGARVRFESGVIGVIALEHQYSKRRELPALEGFFIDTSIDASNAAAVQVGEPGAFIGETLIRGSRITGKSLDNRLNCAVQIEVMRRIAEQGTPHTVYFVFTVQEEVGSRGARPAAYSLEPNLALVLDVTGAGDQPHGKTMETKLGAGVAIKTRDAGLIVPAAVKNLLIQRAEDARIPYQVEVTDGATTDASGIHVARAGIPTGVISIPCRYTHSTSETTDMADVAASIDLLTAVLSQPL